ncbi:MAG: YncE family protein [Thermoplasmata archaeon]
MGIAFAVIFVLLTLSSASAMAAGTPVHARATVPPSGLATDAAISVLKNVAVGKAPVGVAYDPTNKEIYVADSGAGKVSVINGTTNLVVKTLTVGTKPETLLYDPHNARMYVLNLGSHSVTVIRSNNTIAATVSISATEIYNLVYDPTNGAVYALSYEFAPPTSVFYNLSKINPTTNAVTKIKVGVGASSLLYDPATLDLVVADSSVNALSIVNSSTNAVTTVTLTGNYPSSLLYNPANKDVYALDAGYFTKGVTKTGNVSVLSSSNKIVATVKVAKLPISATLDPTSNKVFVVSSGSPNATTGKFPNGVVTVISSTNAVVATVTVGKEALVSSYDPATQDIYMPCGQSNATYVINGTTNVLVGSPIPSKQYPLVGVYDPGTKDMLVAGDSNTTGTPQTTNVTVISTTNTRVTTLILGKGPVDGFAYDPSNLDAYCSNEAAATVSVID